jgi:hypothetical protein
MGGTNIINVLGASRYNYLFEKGGPPIEAEDLTRENKHRGEADELRNIEFVLVTYLTKS